MSNITNRSNPVQVSYSGIPLTYAATPTLLGNSWSQLSAGPSHIAAIKTDGTLWTWGNNDVGQLGNNSTLATSSPIQIGTSSWSQVSSGQNFTLAIKSDGLLYGWGINASGQIGDNTTINKSSPTQIGTSSWTSVSAGASHSAVIRSDNLLFTWGDNTYGQLGNSNGNLLSTSSPVQIGNSSYSIISAKGLNTTAITTDGNLWSWGDNRYNVAGVDSYSTTYSWSQVAASTSFMLAIRADGTLWAWGQNSYGQLGLNDIINRSSPVQVGTNSWTQVAVWADPFVTYGSTLAIRSDGLLFGWGWNEYGDLGLNDIVNRSSPTQIGTNTWSKVYKGSIHSAAIDTSSRLFTWGNNSNGVLGTGNTTAYSSPVQLPGSWASVSASAYYTMLGIRTSGLLYAWGFNNNGQLGDGTTENRSSPVQIGSSFWTSVRTHSGNSYGITTNKKLFAWGNYDGLLKGFTGVSVSQSSPIQIGNFNWLSFGESGFDWTGGTLLKEDSTLWAWGQKNSAQQQNWVSGTPLFSWSQVSAGNAHIIGLLSDGRLFGWGLNNAGETGTGLTTSSPYIIGSSFWTQTAAGTQISAAIKTDNTLWTWGKNDVGQLGDGTTVDKNSPVQVPINSWISISAGGSHMIALATDYTLWGWGDNSSNQLVGSNMSWAKVVAGASHSGYLRSDGIVFMAGTNADGQLGNNSVNASSYLVQVQTNVLFKDIALGNYASTGGKTFGISVDNKLYAWGNNAYGALGDNTAANRSTPVQIGNSSWLMVTAGFQTTSAIKSDGTLWSWGNNSASGTLGFPAFSANTSSPVQVGNKSWRLVSLGEGYTGSAGHALAIDSDYKLWAWGNNIYGGLGVYSPSWTLLKEGFNGSEMGTLFALDDNNTLWAWGNNNSYALAIGTQSSSTFLKATMVDNVSKIETNGKNASFAIKTDGTLWGWGQGSLTASMFSATRVAEISGGNSFTAFIDTSGYLWGVGTNSLGQLGNNTTTASSITSKLYSLPNWYKVSTGSNHTLALKTDGTLWSWGYNTSGQLGDNTATARSSPLQIGTRSNWTQILATSVNSFAINNNYQMFAWGDNANGQIGDGTIITKSSPVQIGGTSWKSLTTGGLNAKFMLAIGVNDTLWSWGDNTYGQLGLLDTVHRSEPTQVGSSSWTQLAIDSSISSGITADGKLFTWGNPNQGALGHSDLVYRSSPTQVGSSSWTQVAIGNYAVIALRQDNTLFTWGNNTTGQLGDGTINSKSSPTQVGTSLYSKVAAGGEALFAVDSSGILWSAGGNLSGQLAYNIASLTSSNTSFLAAGRIRTSASSPTQIGTGSWSQVSAGASGVLAIRSDGTLWAWGDGYYLANTRTNVDIISPIQVGTSSWSFISVAKNSDNVLAIRTDGTLWVWGRNLDGSLGTGDTVDKSIPTQIGADQWATVSAGNSSSFGIKANGSLWSWGNNQYGTLGDGTIISRSSPVQIGTSSWVSLGGLENAFGSVMAIDIAGRLFSWGYNTQGQLGDGTSEHRSSPVQISGGGSWAQVTTGVLQLGMKTDGTIWTWGYGANSSYTINGMPLDNRSSPVQIPSMAGSNIHFCAPVRVNSSSWIQVSSGTDHSLGITSDNTLWSWGRNPYGELGEAGTITGISENSLHIVRNDGVVYGWGKNTYSGVGDGTTTARYLPFDITSTSPSVFLFSKVVGIDPLYGAIAIHKNGTLWTWGNLGSYSGAEYATSLPKQLSTSIWSGQWIDICMSMDGVIAAIKSDGTLWTWGGPAASGSLGNSTTVARSSPVQISSDTNWNKLFGFNDHNNDTSGFYAIKTTGSLWAWGSNKFGLFGNSSTVARSSPVQIGTESWTMVKGGKTWDGVGGVGAMAIGIKTNGTLWTWGDNNYGQLGLNSVGVSTSSPTQVGTLSNWTSVATTGFAAAAVNSNYQLYTWGNGYGNVLANSTGASRSSPVQVSTTTSPIAVVMNSGHQLYVITARGVYASGTSISVTWVLGVLDMSDSYSITTLAAVGTVTTLINRSSPVQISTSSWVQVDAGSFTSAAIKSDGTLWTWGRNNAGQLGTSPLSNRSSPAQVGTSSWSYVAASGQNMSGISGDIGFGWGDNPTGQLGLGAIAAKSSPVQLPAISTAYSTPTLLSTSSWTQISAGNKHTLAITADNRLFAWGDNTYGQLGIGSVESIATVLGSKFYYNGGIISTNGLLYLWGYNDYGHLGNNSISNVFDSAINPGKSWRSVSLGYRFTLGIDSDYKLWALGGDNQYGQLGLNDITNRSSPVQVGTNSWNQVSSGMNHSTLIRSDGTLWAFGFNYFGALGDGGSVYKSSPVQIGTSSWSQVSSGNDFTLAIKADGTLWGWGINQYGQLGDGTIDYKYSPVQIGTSSWSQVSAGSFASCAIRVDGTLWTWGSNTYGQLGDGTTVTKSSPTQIGSFNNWTKAEAGQDFIVALDTYNRLWASGYNYQGQFGDGTITNRNTLSQIFLNKTILDTTVGYYAILALTSDIEGVFKNSIIGAGQNLLINDLSNSRSSPVQVSTYDKTYFTRISSPTQIGTSSWIQVSAGKYHSLGITTANKLWGWGSNRAGLVGSGKSATLLTDPNCRFITSYNELFVFGPSDTGQIGDGTTSPNGRSFPTQISGNWNKLAASSNSTYAIRTDGTLWAWGSNIYGQLGSNDTAATSFPIKIGSATNWQQLFAGEETAYAIKLDSTLWSWGRNSSGQLGDGTTINRSSPIQIGTSSWISVSAGGYVSGIASAISPEYKLFTWGDNTYGALGDGTTINKSSPIQIGTSSWISVSAGGTNTLTFMFAIKPDNTLWAWGRNNYGQLGDGTTVDKSSPVQIGTGYSWTQVSAGKAQTLMLRSDGKLFATGQGTYGSLGDGTTLSRSNPTQLGSESWKLIKAAGATTGVAASYGIRTISGQDILFGWGYGGDGRLGNFSNISSSSPVQILAISESEALYSSPVQIGTSSWSQISAGAIHSTALNVDSVLFAWGDNTAGQLGDNTTINKSSPIQIGTSSWNVVNSGNSYTMMASVTGAFYGSGINNYGQLALNTTTNVSSPATLSASGAGTWSTGDTAFIFPVIVNKSSFTQISGGGAAITTSNLLYTWGSNNIGQLGNYNLAQLPSTASPVLLGNVYKQLNVTPTSLGGSGWSKVSTGYSHAIATKSNGTLWGWGSFAGTNPIITSSYRQISAGANHIAIIEPSGGLWLSGDNTNGQLGDGTTISRSSPVQISGNWIHVTAGDANTAAIRDDGALFIWGLNTYGQVGDNTIASRSSPVQVGTSSWSQVSVGVQHILAIDVIGRLFAWGLNNAKQLGNGTVVNRSSPIQVGTSSWSQVSAAGSHSVMLDINSNVYSVGYNNLGQIGNNMTNGAQGVLYKWPGANYSAIKAGFNNIQVLKSDGLIYSTGQNTNYIVDSTGLNRSAPTQIASSGLFSQLGVGYQSLSSLAINRDGTLWAWGLNSSGQLGDGTTTNKTSPIQIGSRTDWDQVASGGSFAVATTTTGELYMWGNNAYGQLGLGDTINRSSPVQVTTYKTGSSSPVQLSALSWSQISAGNNTNLGVSSNALYFWGLNTSHQSGISTSSPIVVSPTVVDNSAYYGSAGNLQGALIK